MSTFDVTPYLTQDEGQHFERKSLFEGAPGAKRPRDRATVRREIREQVAGLANAEGGVLILGIEDDGTVTGHAYPADEVEKMLRAPTGRLHPPQAPGFLVRHADLELLVFEVAASEVPVHVEGDGFPFRIGDQTTQVPESKIRELKLAGFVESWEARPSEASLDDLDRDLLTQARERAGLGEWSDEEYLIRRKLAQRRGPTLVLRRAAELLFGHAPDHPSASVRLFRVVGTERRVGAVHNVEERERLEGPLPRVLQHAQKEIAKYLRRPSRLVGTRFRETPEYPDFAWKEALLNAIAHRDYGDQGRAIEVWLFDDRMEVVSPGGLVGDLTVDELTSQQRHHASRNPRIARVLVDLGFMREQGEGIPRMFTEMERVFLPEPAISVSDREFHLVLWNTPTLTERDRTFLEALGPEDLSDDEVRAMLEVGRHGRIDNSRLRALCGLDTLTASRLLGRLRDRGLLATHGAGTSTYYVASPALVPTESDRGGLDSDRGGLDDSDRGGLDSDRGGLDADRGGLGEGADPEESNAAELHLGLGEYPPLPIDVTRLLDSLGKRPRVAKTQQAILRLAEVRPMSPQELADHLGLKDVGKLVERHLSPMVADGRLSRTHPDNPSHPNQQYTTTQATIGGEPE